MMSASGKAKLVGIGIAGVVVWLMAGAGTIHDTGTDETASGAPLRDSEGGISQPAGLNPEQQLRLEALQRVQTDVRNPSGAGKIERTAVEPYTRDEYPRIFRKHGRAVSAINADRVKAARIASRDGRCDGVSNGQVSTSSPLTNRHYWVECYNLTRFYFDEDSLRRGEAVDVQTISDMAQRGLRDW